MKGRSGLVDCDSGERLLADVTHRGAKPIWEADKQGSNGEEARASFTDHFFSLPEWSRVSSNG